MIKQVKFTYRGLNQDVTKSKHPFEFYYEANNIRIIATDNQSTASVQNEKGNSLIVTLPEISVNTSTRVITYGTSTLSYVNEELTNQLNEIGSTISGTNEIIGYGITRDSILLFSTDSNGFDAVWEVKDIFESSYELDLLYLRNLGFSKENPIQSVFNYESNIIQKIYWVDAKAQIRFLNIKQSIANEDLEELIDVNSTNINITGEYSLSQPTIPQITQGGIHTSGKIQYAYNLYRINGSQTTISPLSDLVPLDKGVSSGGGDVNEVVGSSPLVNITNLDSRYTHIKLYAIKYTSYNQTPDVTLIVDEEIANYNNFNYFDDGNSISTLTLAEFLFLGSNVFIPRHIESKDNRMIAAAITEKNFDFEIDTRAYSHLANGTAAVWDDVSVDSNNVPVGSLTNLNTTTYLLATNHDAINPDYDSYLYQSDGVTFGGEGLYIKYKINQKSITQLENQDLKFNTFLKDREIYRIAIIFYNKIGQESFPLWIADFKTPRGNLQGNYNTLEVEIKTTEFDAYIASLGLTGDEVPVGYKILRADRTENDKTIICQGSISSMMAQTTRNVTSSSWTNEQNRAEESDIIPKLPIIFQRGRNNFEGVVSPLDHLYRMNGNPSLTDDDQEIFRESDTDFKRQQTWQYNKMMMLNSPEILFDTSVSLVGALTFRVVGLCPKLQTNVWHNNIDTRDGNIDDIGTEEDRTNFTRGDGTGIRMYGLFGPSRDEENDETIRMNFKQYYHEYAGLIPSSSIINYPIYGRPEIVERGQGITEYNNDTKFKYLNSFENFLTDRKKWTGNQNKNEDAITGINSHGSKSSVFVLGEDSLTVSQRPTHEEVWAFTGIASNTDNDKGILIGEYAFPDYYAYVGNIYGGNTYEDKTRNSYLQIGKYQDLTSPIVQIDSAGDTYVQRYEVARIAKTDIEVIQADKMQLTEILSFPVETTINLENRNDQSLGSWNSIRQPLDEEYHNYNRVYSQQPNLVQDTSRSFKFKKTSSFDTKIISSKLKLPGEIIDNWTDFLENEEINLDGEYGAINALVNYRDEIYALQDQGVAHITINPRVQTQANDGVSIELGRGGILYDYEYISTTSGTINKWSVFNSPSGFYYLDAINKSWNKFGSKGLIGLTDRYGLHTYFENNIDYSSLKTDNPLLGLGATGGYDFLNNTSYLTVLQKDKSFTIDFNEGADSFVSFHDYKPSMYITKGSKMYTTSPDINQLYEHDEGEYQTFYGTKYPSTITLQVNPEADLDCVFNNIEYKSELYIDDIDQPSNTLSHISAWNEYQNTGRIPLVLRDNIKRKFRNWRAQIPRNEGSRDRIRNPWIFLKLELDTADNARFILHDLIVHYTI